MKTLMASIFLGAFCATACVSAAREEVIARGPSWPFGKYELVSFNGQSLPAELSDGRVLSGGELTLAEAAMRQDGLMATRRNPGEAGPVSFTMSFDYPEERSRLFLRRRRGSVWLREGTVEGARVPLQLEAWVGASEYVSRGPGFDEFPLELADWKEASGTLFGNELQVGDGEKSLVFMRRGGRSYCCPTHPAEEGLGCPG